MSVQSNPSLRTAAALRTLQSQGRYLFLASEFALLTGRAGQTSATRLALSRLARAGQITSLGKQRPSTWLIVPPEHQHFGAPPITWWLDDFLRDAEPGYYLALLSAARHWGSAHFASQVTQVMLARRRRPLTVGRLKLEFISKRNVARTPVEIVSHSVVAPYRVSTRAATLLDLVRHQNEVGGLETSARIARDLVPKLTRHGLIEALNALDQTVVAQRLGFMLSHIDKQLSRAIAGWLEPRRIQKQALDPSAGRRDGAVPYSREWGIEFTPQQYALLREIQP